MVVATHEADAAAAVFSLGVTTPHECLFGAKAFLAVFIPEVDVTHCLLWGRHGGGKGMAVLAFLFSREAHVVVKLIIGGDGFLKAFGNGMTFSCRHVGNPMGIH